MKNKYLMHSCFLSDNQYIYAIFWGEVTTRDIKDVSTFVSSWQKEQTNFNLLFENLIYHTEMAVNS